MRLSFRFLNKQNVSSKYRLYKMGLKLEEHFSKNSVSKWHRKILARMGASGLPMDRPSICLYNNWLKIKHVFSTAVRRISLNDLLLNPQKSELSEVKICLYKQIEKKKCSENFLDLENFRLKKWTRQISREISISQKILLLSKLFRLKRSTKKVSCKFSLKSIFKKLKF